MTLPTRAALAALCLAAGLATASAQTPTMPGMDHGAMPHGMPAPSGSPSTDAFAEAAGRMHTDMAITYSGNADVDFAFRTTRARSTWRGSS